MLGTIGPILAPILVFGIVVFVHELGHFLAAKLTGVYAPRFSIGFGPALLRKRWGETEYVLAALPLGGYVRMASREDDAVAFLEGGPEDDRTGVPTTGANAAGRVADDEAGSRRHKDWDPDALMPFGPRPVPEHRWFESKPLWARLFILIAGVSMNVLLTFGVYAGMLATYGRPQVPPAVIDSVLADKPAAMAGLRGGDSIVAVGGVPVRHWGDVIQHVSGKTSGSLAIDVIRNGERQQIVVSPEPTEVPDPATGEPRTVGRIGAAPREPRMERLGVGGVIGSAAGLTWDRGTEVIRVVGGLLTGKVSVSNLGGPIAIARTSVEAARSGVQTVLLLLAFLSINIAVLNMLPIPVLDGGQILINLLEAAKGSAFSVRTREYILRFGLLAIGLLFVTVMWNDLSRLVRELLG